MKVPSPASLVLPDKLCENVLSFDRTGAGVSLYSLFSIEDPTVIKKILDHVKKKVGKGKQIQLPANRAPPQITLFD